MLRLSCLFLIVMCFVLATSSEAAPLFFTSEAAWAAETSNIENFDTTRSNVALADEQGSFSGNNTTVGGSGGVLTWQAAQTGLSQSFRFTSLNGSITYGDNEVGTSSPAAGGFEDALSVGDIDNAENDDWQVEILSGNSITAFGAFIGDNNGASGESFSVFGTDGQLLGTSTAIPTASNFAFIGVVSDVAIGRVVFDEDSGGDDISVRNFRFGSNAVPEPATVLCLGFALGCLAIVQRRKLQ